VVQAVSGVLAGAALIAVTGVSVAASDVEPAEPSGSPAVDVTFDCAADQTPNLFVPSENYDEVFPAGTTTTQFSFGEIDFADVALFIDCTPYDNADVECFSIAAVINPPATEVVLEADRLDPTDPYCTLPTRPIGSASASTSTTPTPNTVPSGPVTPPADLPATGHSEWLAVAAGVLLILGGLLTTLARRTSRPAH
jgi:LPXTG-motif cell wall-anchored protein